jgi:hypothetical protein
MDHTKATEIHAAERYVLGELPAEEAEDFERHFFECAVCAEAVEGGTEFIANARAALATPTPQPIQGSTEAGPQRVVRVLKRNWSWPRWIPIAVAAALAVIVLYQGAFVIPGMRQALESPRALPAFQLAGLSRGTAPLVSVPPGTAWLSLASDLPPDARFPQYLAVLASGERILFRVNAAPPGEGQPLSVLVPAGSLSPGEYEFIVYGLNTDGQQRDKVTSSPFKFQFQ